jgi:hypothetical protein
MNVTREVVTDLLPIYFSGEASGDTKVLVEDYFRQDPDFERLARSAATPLETLRTAPPVVADQQKEKRDLESILWGLRRRTWLFGVSLYLTLAPLSVDFNGGPIMSVTVRDGIWRAAFKWSLAAVLWFLYLAQLRLRLAALVCAIGLTLIPIPFVLHSAFARGPVWQFAIYWIVAGFVWLGYFKGKRLQRSLRKD